MSDLLNNTHFWLIIAFSVTIILLISTTHRIVNNLLTKKINDVTDDINNSLDVLNEATDLLNESSTELLFIEKSLSESSLKSKNEDDSYYEKYISNLNTKIKMNKETFNNYLDIQYTSSILEHKKKIVHKSIENVMDYIDKNLDEIHHNKLINDSIENFSKKL
jgi:F0F1-type ATP synthase membrane subunit b/b'